jgi:multidrug efflux system membrane fusion protein
LRRFVTVYGTIVPEPASAGRPAALVTLAASSSGLVTAVPTAIGDRVERGAIVVRLDTRMADAAVISAQARFEQAAADAERQRRLAALDDASKKRLELAERLLAETEAELADAQAARDLLEVRSPLSGTVLEVDARTGEVVGAGDPLVQIVDLGRLVVQVDVPAADLPRLRRGQPAIVQVPSGTFDGRLVYVDPRIDPSSGTATARIEPSSTERLRPGQFVRARLVAEERRDALAVPSVAVIHGPAGTGTVVLVDEGVARHREVRLGIEDDGWIEISGDDVRAGDPVVTREAYGLPDGIPLRVVSE